MAAPLVFKQLKYPLDLRTNQSTIRFSCRDGKEPGATIDLPIPRGVKFSDGGEYGTKDLGAEAAVAGDLSNAVNSPSIANLAKGGAALGGTAIANKIIDAVGDHGSALSFYSKKIVPSNTNTIFKGNTMRTFSFDFTMVARTAADTSAIRDIHQTLRRFIYAGAADGIQGKLINSYPPVWTIEFFTNESESVYYPKIFSCYMTGVDCSLGNLSIAKMANGAPIDVELSVNFQETRVLNRNDIDKMEKNNDRGIDLSTGFAQA